MKISRVSIRNFRRLEDVTFSLEDDHTVCVGPNNSGKTSAAAGFRLFLKSGDFTMSDFTVACIADIDAFGADEEAKAEDLPSIEMDIWLTVSAETEFGRVFALLPNVLETFSEVGIRLKFSVSDAEKLRADYAATFPPDQKPDRKALSHFLGLPRILSKHFSLNYFALESSVDGIKTASIDPDEARKLLRTLVRVDFIDAQRNIHDEENARHNRLSSAFAAYYRYNLNKPADNEEATRVIDDNNSRLNAHYDAHFKPLLTTISRLGVPSAHDRSLRLVSTMSAQEALRGSTELFYVDAALKHELPEAYNGLGFKNLVYMAIQISHYHAQWLATEKDRELCQLIFIEEPEVHLHAQVQQVFVNNIWKILNETAKGLGEEARPPQLVITTHSSHIVDSMDFEKIRYFRRSKLSRQQDASPMVLNATEVLSLKDFRPSIDQSSLLSPEEASLDSETKNTLIRSRTKKAERETITFLKKYLKLTHCDLFFADAAILVEGTVEKLLMPQMIEAEAEDLRSKYLTILEIGGAFAHRFAGLIAYLGIPYLVITDIDTVEAGNSRKACKANAAGCKTSNEAIKQFLELQTRDELVALDPNKQILAKGNCYVAFQRPVTVVLAELAHELHGRTLEETFVYENLPLFTSGALILSKPLTGLTDPTAVQDLVYEEIRSDHFKKTDFALAVAALDVNWKTPAYIANGLKWLATRLTTAAPDSSQPLAAEAAAA